MPFSASSTQPLKIVCEVLTPVFCHGKPVVVDASLLWELLQGYTSLLVERKVRLLSFAMTVFLHRGTKTNTCTEFRKVLNYPNPTTLIAVQDIGNKSFNKFLIHFETSIFSYSLHVLAQVATGQAQSKTLEASLEKIAGQESNVLFCRHALMGTRPLGMSITPDSMDRELSLTFRDLASNIYYEEDASGHPFSECPRGY